MKSDAVEGELDGEVRGDNIVAFVSLGKGHGSRC